MVISFLVSSIKLFLVKSISFLANNHKYDRGLSRRYKSHVSFYQGLSQERA